MSDVQRYIRHPMLCLFQEHRACSSYFKGNELLQELNFAWPLGKAKEAVVMILEDSPGL